MLQLLKPKGLLIFESWAQGNEHFATPKDAEAGRGWDGRKRSGRDNRGPR